MIYNTHLLFPLGCCHTWASELRLSPSTSCAYLASQPWISSSPTNPGCIDRNMESSDTKMDQNACCCNIPKQLSPVANKAEAVMKTTSSSSPMVRYAIIKHLCPFLESLGRTRTPTTEHHGTTKDVKWGKHWHESTQTQQDKSSEYEELRKHTLFSDQWLQFKG